jgi:hypothetical protein
MVVFKTCLVWGLLRITLIRAVQFDSATSIEPTLVLVYANLFDRILCLFDDMSRTNDSVDSTDSTFLFPSETLLGLTYGPWEPYLPEHIFREETPSTASSDDSSIFTTDSYNWEATDDFYEELVRLKSNYWLRSALGLTLAFRGSGDDDEEEEESRRKRRRIQLPREFGLRALIRLFFSRYNGDKLDTKYESNETTDHPLLVQYISNLQNLRHLERKLRDTENEICVQRQVLRLSQNYQGSIKVQLRLARQQRRVVNARKKVLKSMRRCWDEGVLDESDGLSEDAPHLSEVHLDECERVSDRKSRDRQTPLTIYEDRESILGEEEERLSDLPQPVNIIEDGEWSIHATLALAAISYDGDLQPTGETNPWRAYDEAPPSSFMRLSETPSDDSFPFTDLDFVFHEDENNWLSSNAPMAPQGGDEQDFGPSSNVIPWPVTPSPGITNRSGSELQPNKLANSFGQYSELPYPSPDLISPRKPSTSNSDTIDLKDMGQPSSSDWIEQGTGDYNYSPPTRTYLPSPSSTEQTTPTSEGKSYCCSHCSRRYSRPSELK